MTIAPNPSAGDSYYAAHRKIHPREVHGRFDRRRRAAVFALLGLFYVLPWVRWDHRPLILFDLPARKFWIGPLVLWPQDFIFLTWLLVVLGVSLFFFTALAGRLWCGYACPQTVWTELFLWLERWAEGDRAKRLKLERAPWGREKIARKALKQLSWVLLALWTGVSFVGFFVPIRTLFEAAAHATLGGWPLFWTLFYSFAVYGNAGYLREQVCEYMCPYARFQSAMFDRDTLIITYDRHRGEPRGSRSRQLTESPAGLGDCIDCTVCVQVCPTGIDIREGLQYQCIACAACVDACDQIMDQMHYPRGLIRYTTQNALDQLPTSIWRPRTAVYAAILTVIVGSGVIGLARRPTVALDVLRDRSALYRQLADDRIENVYLLKILNKDTKSHVYRVTISGLDTARLATDQPLWSVAAGEVYTGAVRVDTTAASLHGGHDLIFTVADVERPSTAISRTARYIAP